MILRRHPTGPILTRSDIPVIPPEIRDPSSVFNPGAVAHRGMVRLLLRVQTRGRRTFLVPAESRDGIRFRVADRIARVEGLEGAFREVFHVYDPRITSIEGELMVTLALDTDRGCRLATTRTDDLERLEVVGIDRDRDARNGVIFPERVGGRYLRLDRPNRVRTEAGVLTGSEIWLSESDDLASWRPVGPVMAGRPHYWDEWIGAGPPPIRTRQGWLLLYHGVATHFASANVYQAGAALLDLEDPTRVLARSRDNVLEPREPHELTGQVPNVVFPSGWVAEGLDPDGAAGPDGRLRIYYGAADTCVGLAETTAGELLAACREKTDP